MLLDSCDTSVCTCRGVKQIIVEMLPTEVVNSVVQGGVATISVHIVAKVTDLVECFLGDFRVSIHAEEETQVEHSLDLFHFEKVAHVLDKLALELVSALFVPVHRVAFLW